jgi:UDP-glucose 4-epimerase
MQNSKCKNERLTIAAQGMGGSALDAARDDAGETILVTGAAGLLGGAVVRGLLEEYPTGRVVAAVRGRSVPERLKEIVADGKVAARVTIVHGDLSKPHVWGRLPDTITRAIHLAARIERDAEAARRAEVVRDNLGPIAHLVEWAQRSPCLRQVVYASSVSVYGNTTEMVSEATPPEPANLYAAAKLAGEDLLGVLTARGVCVTCLRYSSLYGPGMYAGTVLPLMIRQACEKNEITVFGAGRRAQDFLHVADAAQAALLACRHTAAGIFNVAAGTSTTMADLARIVSEAFAAGRARVRLAEERPDGPPGYVVDVRKAHHVLGFRARYDLAAGLREMERPSGVARSCVPSLS